LAITLTFEKYFKENSKNFIYLLLLQNEKKPLWCIVDIWTLSRHNGLENRIVEGDHTFILPIFIVEKNRLAGHKIKMDVVRVGLLFLFIFIIQCKY
jgi:hypothetical protein